METQNSTRTAPNDPQNIKQFQTNSITSKIVPEMRYKEIGFFFVFLFSDSNKGKQNQAQKMRIKRKISEKQEVSLEPSSEFLLNSLKIPLPKIRKIPATRKETHIIQTSPILEISAFLTTKFPHIEKFSPKTNFSPVSDERGTNGRLRLT